MMFVAELPQKFLRLRSGGKERKKQQKRATAALTMLIAAILISTIYNGIRNIVISHFSIHNHSTTTFPTFPITHIIPQNLFPEFPQQHDESHDSRILRSNKNIFSPSDLPSTFLSPSIFIPPLLQHVHAQSDPILFPRPHPITQTTTRPNFQQKDGFLDFQMWDEDADWVYEDGPVMSDFLGPNIMLKAKDTISLADGGEGTAKYQSIGYPSSLAISKKGGHGYVNDFENGRILMIEDIKNPENKHKNLYAVEFLGPTMNMMVAGSDEMITVLSVFRIWEVFVSE